MLSDHFQLLEQILFKGCSLKSSGTTGEPKTIHRSPENLQSSMKAAIESQSLSANSSVYTVTKLDHAGGLLAQTLPAFSIGATIKIEKFNPYGFLSEFRHHTHTFLPPDFMVAVSQTKNFRDYDFGGRFILTGSDPVPWDIMSQYLSRNAVVQPNWGMTEIGPITINSTLASLEDLEFYRRKAPHGSTLLGDRFYCDYKVVEGELFVKGDLCVYEGWFATGDLVEQVDGILFYRGRKD